MRRRIGYAVVWSLCAALIGFLLGTVIVPEEQLAAGAFFAVSGAMMGLALGGRLIGVTGWLMLAGAIAGGAVAFLGDGHGKAHSTEFLWEQSSDSAWA